MLSELTDGLKSYLRKPSNIPNEENRKRPLSSIPDAIFSETSKRPRLNENLNQEQSQDESLTNPLVNIFTWMVDFPMRNYFTKKFIDKIKSLKSVNNIQEIETMEKLNIDKKQIEHHSKKTNYELSDKQLTRAPLHSDKYKQPSSCVTGTIPKDFNNKLYQNDSSELTKATAEDYSSDCESRKPNLFEKQVSNRSRTHLKNSSTETPDVCFLTKIATNRWNNGLQTNDLSSKYKRIRYSTLNGRRKVMTAQESVRLYEKEQYKILLQQHTSESLFNATKRIASMKDAQVQSDLSYGKPHLKMNKRPPFKMSTPVRREKLDKESNYNVIDLLSSISMNIPHTNVRKTSTPKEYFPTLHLGNESNFSKFSLLKENREKQPPIKYDDDDSVIITKVEAAKPHKEKFPRKKAETPFFNKKWLNELRETIERQDEEEKKKIRHQEEVTRSLREKREAKYANAEEEIKELLKRRGVAVLEEKLLENEEQLADFPALSTEMELEVDEALKPNPPDEVLAEGFRLSVARRDMETLAGLNWLNDEIINYYMNLLMERSKLDNYPTVYTFNTFFYPKLLGSGHSALRRWTRKVDIFSYDMLLIPVHMGVHWCLAVIDFRHRKIQYYDSMGGQNDECLNALRTYLQDEKMDKKKEEFDMSGWGLETVKNIPHQMNGSDCGMFALKYAEYITRDAKINFTQGDMPYFRRRMVFEILKKQLL